ncbi:MAG TPA: DUF2303 family protein [Ramlibacter sp.]|nr:DUF2303 family protein [Ramlibacter sp.]
MNQNTNEALPLGELRAIHTDAAALLAAGRALGTVIKNPDQDGQHFVLMPEGFTLETLPTAETPKRPMGTVKLRDAASFIRYYKDHAVARSRIYAQLDPARFLAVFDDHHSHMVQEVPPAEGSTEAQALATHFPVTEQADWRNFRAEFLVPASREWKLWTEANKRQMSQQQFAEFVLDNTPDIVVPDGSTLYDMAIRFEAAQTGRFKSHRRESDGSTAFEYVSETAAVGQVTMPELLKLRIPVFENEAARDMDARLRYRIEGESLKLWYELVRPHKVLEAAFREAWSRIEAETRGVILLGAPE